MKYGCCTVMENYDLLAESGYDYIELAGKDVAAMSEEEFAAHAKKIDAGKVKCNGFNAYCATELAIVGPNASLEQAKAYAKIIFSRAKALNAVSVGIGSPKSRVLPQGFDRGLARRQLAEFLRATAKIAAENGILVLMESVCADECNFINLTDEALEVVEELKLPNLGLVYDIYHALKMEESLCSMEHAFPYIRHMHVSAPEGHAYLTNETHSQYAPYIEKAVEMRYDGIISVEAFAGDIRLGAPQSLEILKQLIEK